MKLYEDRFGVSGMKIDRKTDLQSNRQPHQLIQSDSDPQLTLMIT